jgi:hypothetical protein
MNKKGQLSEVIVASVMIILTLVSVFTIITLGNDVIYGDSSTNYYFKYSECKSFLSKINQSNLIIFESEKKAVSKGFHKGDDKCQNQ